MRSVIVAPNNCPYDVGDILTTMNTTAPSERWPGTSWTQITDCMLRAADDDHPAGSAGGAWEVTQTVEQMPKHRHTANGVAIKNGYQSSSTNDYFTMRSYERSNITGQTEYVNYTGSGQPMPIVNKYIVCYMWRRTA